MSAPLPPLTFTHRFASGNAVELRVTRQAGRLPKVQRVSDPLSRDDHEEYLRWRTQVTATLMSVLTPGEVFACQEHGEQIVHGAKP